MYHGVAKKSCEVKEKNGIIGEKKELFRGGNMEFIDERYDFDVMLFNDLIAEVRFLDGKVQINRVCDNRRLQVFAMKDPQASDVYLFLKSRCYEDGRGDLEEILKAVGLRSNNPWEWCRITHGLSYGDNYWIRLKGEDLKWEDIKLHE